MPNDDGKEAAERHLKKLERQADQRRQAALAESARRKAETEERQRRETVELSRRKKPDPRTTGGTGPRNNLNDDDD